MSTEPLFVPALASLDDLVPHERPPDSPDELEDIARDLAASTELWQPLVHSDAERRRYELVYEDDRMDAWILSWMPGQGHGVPRPLHLRRRALCRERLRPGGSDGVRRRATVAQAPGG